ncbi:DegT/DnrJ/EryC1/StrS family aminotransferase [Nonomuraea sp. KC401]|uniref:DegT/DnrJ/EryC1/StrS family aminotransferase n=1 Tax=unclassified Nonomuraea TaxID=2593643 RepID=UPI0010FE835C|nr:DegT/DnrJ/EryC1/StrS family aminotransferase [Nonomuraea sp. KC401]NBE97569.1 glutamine--scyllo-inositol aminotransferase [Nonomuraea sp. K271]TLF64089.1 DegT/DnrJ/EryC1/StrS family aminotransferase [Nonomuraea sp. KC401]
MKFPSMAEADGRTLGDEEVAAVERVIRSGMLNSVWGTEARELEREVARMYGSRHAIACSSGTAALHLSVVAAAPDPGDEIITTPITDFGTVAPILAQNAVPVFADVDPSDGNLDPGAVAALIGPRTRAIMAVHLFGAPARIHELRALADEHGLTLIEDCAQAWLAELPGGGLAGTTGHVACLSLQQWKHITCGDGGVAITRDEELARRMRLFSDKGWDRAAGRSHAAFGLNYRMSELQAAVARAQLAKLPGVLAARRRTALQLMDALKDQPGVRLPRPQGHAWWLFPIVCPGGDAPELAAHLATAGVPARAGYLAEPLNRAPVWEARIYGTARYPLDGYTPNPCPRAERMVDRTLLVIDWNENYTSGHVEAIAQEMARYRGRA